MRFSDLVGFDRRPDHAPAAERTPVDTDTYLNELADEPRNNGFVTGIVDARRGRRMKASRRGFLRGTIAAVAAGTAATTAGLFGPARRVEAQGGVVGTYPRRILQFCPPYNSGDNCQPGCGSSPICTDCCGADGFFRNDPANGYSLYAGGCGDGDIADGWIWRYSGKCGNCAEIEYRCSDGYVQTDTGPAPFICRSVTDCVPLADGEEPGEALPDAARDTNWRPAGALEVAVDQGGSVAINGWIADGSGVPVQMRIRANNSIVHLGVAGLSRPDIASRVSGAGTNVGFAVSFPIDPGDYEFCVDALQGVLNANIGCVRMNVGSGGSVRGSGTTGSISPAATPTPADDDTDGDDSAEPTPTPEVTPGEVVVPTPGPASATDSYGAVMVIRRSDDATGFVSGWAGDADTEDPVFIEVSVDGEVVSTTRSDLPRVDVARAFGLHAATGFAVSFPLPAGSAEVCVEAVSPDDAARTPLGCQRLGADAEPATADESVDDGRPQATGSPSPVASVVYGAIESVDTPAGGAVITGWCFDPNDRARSITVTARAGAASADAENDVASPQIGARFGTTEPCGFEIELPLTSGAHDLVVEASAADGTSIVLGERTLDIP